MSDPGVAPKGLILVSARSVFSTAVEQEWAEVPDRSMGISIG